MSLNTIFNSLPNPNCLREVGETHQKEILKIGSIICDYNLERVYGVGILHNHYHITTGEKVVRTVVGDTLVIQPMKISPSQVCPYLWKIADDGTWVPLEFEYKTQTPAVYQKSSSEDEFKTVILKYILDNGLQNKLGILKLNRSLLPSSDFHYLEDTDCEARISVMELTPNKDIKPSDMYSSFIFTKNASVVFTACPTLCNHHDTHAGRPKTTSAIQTVNTACPTLCNHHDTHAGQPPKTFIN